MAHTYHSRIFVSQADAVDGEGLRELGPAPLEQGADTAPGLRSSIIGSRTLAVRYIQRP